MAERQPQAIGGDLQDFGLQRHAVAQVGGDHDGDVELAADQQVLEVVAIVLDGRHLDGGMGAAITGEKIGEHVAGDQRGDAELQPAGGDLFAIEEGAPRVRHVGEDLGCVAQELMALVGDVQPARMALEQRDAEIALQLLDRLGDRRLRDRQILRGARNSALLGDGDEILQLPDGEGHGSADSSASADWERLTACRFVTIKVT